RGAPGAQAAATGLMLHNAGRGAVLDHGDGAFAAHVPGPVAGPDTQHVGAVGCEVEGEWGRAGTGPVLGPTQIRQSRAAVLPIGVRGAAAQLVHEAGSTGVADDGGVAGGGAQR